MEGFRLAIACFLRRWPMSLLVLAGAFLVACGASATATPELETTGDASPGPTAEAGADTATPTPEAEAVKAPQAVEGAGVLNVARAEIQRFSALPALMQGPNQTFVGATIGEGLLNIDASNEIVGMLAESWEISEDAETWTFNLRQGVEFHKGYGEMTAADVVWSYQGFGENTTHPRATVMKEFWADAEALDQRTVEVRPQNPTVLIQMAESFSSPAGGGTWVASQQQAQDIGDEAANRDTATTGPWEYVTDTAENWQMRAVEDHWRQTPYFQELVLWEVPEESSRIAGMSTGNLDTTEMSIESVPRVQEIEGVELMSVPGALNMNINIYGGWYVGAGTPEAEEGYNPELPWVSENPDPESEAWQRAVKVRQALYLAIDWEAIVEELFSGFGEVDPHIRGYGSVRHVLGDRGWFEYNPDRARQLLQEAGYGDGFSVTLTPVMLRPFEPLTCEAMAQMWETELGLDVNLQKIAYGAALRPTIIGRSYEGVTCHAGSPVLGPSVQLPLYHSTTVWNPGANHPWLDAKIDDILATVDPEERQQLEAEAGQWVFDNALTYLIPFTLDAVWPVGPKIQEWSKHVRRADLRYQSGFEYIQPR